MRGPRACIDGFGKVGTPARRHRRDALRALLTGALGVGAALTVSACAGSAGNLIPSADSSSLQGDFEVVAQAAESGNGNCAGTEAALLKTEQDLTRLPAAVDTGLHARLQEGIAKLREDALARCAKPLSSTGTTSTSKTAPSKSTPAKTQTTSTETQSTSTETQPTTSTSTSTNPAGGTGVPENEGPAGAGGQGAGGQGDGGQGNGGQGNGGPGDGGPGGGTGVGEGGPPSGSGSAGGGGVGAGAGPEGVK